MDSLRAPLLARRSLHRVPLPSGRWPSPGSCWPRSSLAGRSGGWSPLLSQLLSGWLGGGSLIASCARQTGRLVAVPSLGEARPRLEPHRCIGRGPGRCRDPDRALQRSDAPGERDRRTLDRRMPARAPGPHARLEPGPSAADLARVRDPPQSAPAAPLPGCSCAAETSTGTGRSQAVPRPPNTAWSHNVDKDFGTHNGHLGLR